MYLQKGHKANLLQDGTVPYASYAVSIVGSANPVWIRTVDREHAQAAFDHVEKTGSPDNFNVRGR